SPEHGATDTGRGAGHDNNRRTPAGPGVFGCARGHQRFSLSIMLENWKPALWLVRAVNGAGSHDFLTRSSHGHLWQGFVIPDRNTGKGKSSPAIERRAHADFSSNMARKTQAGRQG